MTDLYLATDQEGRQVVLRVIKSSHHKERAIRKQFLHGIDVLKKLDHPNIIRLLDYGKIHGHPWMSVAFYEGQDLRERIANHDTHLHTYAYRLVYQLAETLWYLHRSGYLHMDLKPENILITHEMQPILIDFDLAMRHKYRSLKVKKLSGTAHFLAPETYHNHIIDERAEIFAFGAAMYELLSGHKPFLADSSHDYKRKLMDLHTQPAAIRHHRAGVAASLEMVILKCLAKRREDRYPSMSLVLKDLEAVL